MYRYGVPGGYPDQFSPPPPLPRVSPGSLLQQDITSPNTRNLYYSQNISAETSNDCWGNNGEDENSKWSASPSLDGIRQRKLEIKDFFQWIY